MAAKKGYKEFFEVFRDSHAEQKPLSDGGIAPDAAENPQDVTTSENEPRHSDKPSRRQPEKDGVRVDREGRRVKQHAYDAMTSGAAVPPTIKPVAQGWAKGRTRPSEINITKKILRDAVRETPPAAETPAAARETAPGDLRPSVEEVATPLRKEDVRVSQETIIIVAVAATVLSIATFFLGYKVGGNNSNTSPTATGYDHTVNQQPTDTATDDDEDEGNSNPLDALTGNIRKDSGVTDVQQPTGDIWTLRIISYKNNRANLLKATELAKAIKNMTHTNAFVAKVGKELTVCVGRFKSDNDQALIDLQIKISGLVYENKKQFKGCYPVKLK